MFASQAALKTHSNRTPSACLLSTFAGTSQVTALIGRWTLAEKQIRTDKPTMQWIEVYSRDKTFLMLSAAPTVSRTCAGGRSSCFAGVARLLGVWCEVPRVSSSNVRRRTFNLFLCAARARRSSLLSGAAEKRGSNSRSCSTHKFHCVSWLLLRTIGEREIHS